MGMSASQARLLTLTARLNHNELRSQQVMNAKIRLSDATEQASDEYIQALNSTELSYTTYDTLGNATTQRLTGGALYTYSPIKQQYGLVNAAGQLLVTELDGNNFEESDNMEEFLDKYGLLAPLDQSEVIQVKNPEYTLAWDDYNSRYLDWKSSKPKIEDFTTTEYIAKTDNEIYQSVITSGGCLSGAIAGTGCYMHVLSDLIGPGEVTTSDGVTYTIYDTSPGNGGCGEHNRTWCWNSAYHGVSKFAPITEMLKKGTCSGDVIEGGSEVVNAPYGTVTVGGPASDPEMTLWQRCVDLLWDVHEEYVIGNSSGGPATSESLEKFFYLKQAVKEEVTTTDTEGYNKALTDWEAAEPSEPQVAEYIDKTVRTITDSDEAQWYINLWHRMNGESDYKAGYMNSANYDPEEDGWVTDSKTGQSYAILEDGLMNDPSYLQFALRNGVITMEEVRFSDPNESGNGLKKVAWTSIEYTSATEFNEVVNDNARTKAEVKYEAAQRDLEAKDKEYDNQLKLLDTEHNALQTEYESIQNVINKNVERTFKTFS